MSVNLRRDELAEHLNDNQNYIIVLCTYLDEDFIFINYASIWMLIFLKTIYARAAILEGEPCKIVTLSFATNLYYIHRHRF
jgi:hypothetical protein